ncbi:Ycf66 family protein [Leptolyngbya sp. CCNP1308]|uniref:Ycf66 family protein n=1 Tax=Leptolyngbya sp. CCNP1308 TaxID=3110255 RepID=UPI002B20D7C3|nr:Ycf66 family protein [Leptolyngbya sp. CCNP1308]MEA5447231.1 Ycf66 family protein [Leptolyngbya sp. CCNP1308]
MNFGTPVPLLLGIFMVLCGVALFFLDRLKPGYERDSDKVYAILFLLSGVFLLGNLTMDIIPSFQQMLMVGMLVSLMIQNINSRTPLVRTSFQGDGGDFGGGGGYRPPRGSRPPVYAPDNRTNLRAELDRRDYGPADPYNRPRPMLEGRGEPTGRPPYNPDVYGDGRPMRREDIPMDRPMDRSDGRSMGDRPLDGPDGPPYYDSNPRPGDDRVRRRRPPKSRSEYNDRYRIDPGPQPPRPDYRPDRDQL